MAKKVCVVIRKKSLSYPVFSLRQPDTDVSLYLELTPGKNGTFHQADLVQLVDNTARVTFSSIKPTSNKIRHSSYHATGKVHTRLKGGGALHESDGMALTNLRHPKYICSLILRGLEYSNTIKLPRTNDLILDQPDNINNWAIDLIAVPKVPLIFNTNYQNNAPNDVALNIGFYIAHLVDYNVVLSVRGTNEFKESPPKTIKISASEDTVPYVTNISKKYVDIELKRLVFGELMNIDPDEGAR